MDNRLYVKFWGTRGSCAAPFGDRMKYGGNTSCMSAAWEGGLAVFDGGTGIAALGRYLEGEGPEGGEAFLPVPEGGYPVHIFIGHLHLDHISGLPLFSAFFRKEANIHIYGETRGGLTLRQALGRVLGPPYWPVSFDDMPARISWHEIEAGREYLLEGGARLSTMRAGHPDQCTLYRLEAGGSSVVYGLDCELTEALWGGYREFARSCSLLVFDAPYTQEEYPDYRGFGHGTWEQGIEMARQCGAGRLCLSHHEWGRRDSELEKIEELARRQGINAEFAAEGKVIFLGNASEGRAGNKEEAV